MADFSADDASLSLSAIGLRSGRRARLLILLGVLFDAGLAAFPLGRIVRLQASQRASEWPALAAAAAIFLVPAAIAVYSTLSRRPLLDVAILLNAAALLAFPQSLIVVPIVLVPTVFFLLAWTWTRSEQTPSGRALRATIAILGIAAALTFSLAPSQHILWSTASSNGHVVKADARVVASCPSSLGQVLTAGEDDGANGCDPSPGPHPSELSLGLSALALGAASVARPRARPARGGASG